MRFGYKASAEQFGPRELLDFSIAAELAGFESVAVSDHFQPWRHATGHAPFSLGWLTALGERTEEVILGTSVLTPTLRYHPSVVAHGFATLACLNPGRVFLGIGSGEAMNEKPAIGIEWPKFQERSARLAEAVELIRRLWTDDRVTFDGAYYHTERATIYDRPETPIPIYIAAGGPQAARLVGKIGDGFICTSGKRPELYEQLLGEVRAGAAEAGRVADAIEHMIEIKVSYEETPQDARDACRWWAALALTGEEKSGIEDPVEMERLADEKADRAHTRFICADDAAEIVERIEPYVRLGFTNLVFHFPGADQRSVIERFSTDVLPLMRERWVTQAPTQNRYE